MFPDKNEILTGHFEMGHVRKSHEKIADLRKKRGSIRTTLRGVLNSAIFALEGRMIFRLNSFLTLFDRINREKVVADHFASNGRMQQAWRLFSCYHIQSDVFRLPCITYLEI